MLRFQFKGLKREVVKKKRYTLCPFRIGHLHIQSRKRKYTLSYRDDTPTRRKGLRPARLHIFFLAKKGACSNTKSLRSLDRLATVCLQKSGNEVTVLPLRDDEAVLVHDRSPFYERLHCREQNGGGSFFFGFLQFFFFRNGGGGCH